MVELKRFELLTSCLQSRRSNQLSYSPLHNPMHIIAKAPTSINLTNERPGTKRLETHRPI